MNTNIAVIIPAYNPDEKLIKLVNEINNEITNKIIVVNDGSKSKKVFEKIENKCEVLENMINKGKGYSLKEGLTYVLKQENDFIGIITTDADGQHSVKDIKNIAKELEEDYRKNNEKIILGTRDFDKENVPIKNRLGNKITANILEKKTGIKIKDTQTGLRGIPIKYIEELINVKGDRYEYEQNVLIYIIEKHIPYKELSIDTIYNKSKSNFNVVIDSYKIIKAIIKCKRH